ncbi:hypothetical protein HBDW_12590 [Herbaspirillum sp. DW155]|uniref:hypothetical protein n=1 Tax=Herbaspirillum sp. DW155 TaxID=3095609 RepID=UPI003089FF68|nr:hypothetical protein HBDW_12590 [Herbaspirillum sp. DW155]
MELIWLLLQFLWEGALSTRPQAGSPFSHTRRLLLSIGCGVMTCLVLIACEYIFPGPRPVSEVAGGLARICLALTAAIYLCLLLELWINKRKRAGKSACLKACTDVGRPDS